MDQTFVAVNYVDGDWTFLRRWRLLVYMVLRWSRRSWTRQRSHLPTWGYQIHRALYSLHTGSMWRTLPSGLDMKKPDYRNCQKFSLERFDLAAAYLVN